MSEARPQTSNRKLSQIRPCDFCGGKIAPIFFVVQVKHAAFNARACNQTLALAQGFGLGLGIAEAMGARADEAVVVLEEGCTELFVCNNCYCKGPLDISRAAEAVREKLEAVPS